MDKRKKNFNLNGYLITYNSSSRNDITRINHFLFGRVASITRAGKKEKYYYPGFFESTPYKKINNGCYFVQEINDDFDGLLSIHQATISFEDEKMLNSRDYWKGKIKGLVNNW
jgi:hypothetical protein